MPSDAEKLNAVINTTQGQIQSLLLEMSRATDADKKKGFASLALKEVAKAQKLQAQLNQMLAQAAR
jgi:hypothetical protein